MVTASQVNTPAENCPDTRQDTNNSQGTGKSLESLRRMLKGQTDEGNIVTPWTTYSFTYLLSSVLRNKPYSSPSNISY